MRRGEILAIKKEHFDPDKRTLLIPVARQCPQGWLRYSTEGPQ
jgi:hypothetical protein